MSNSTELNSFNPTLTEQLTANFYNWEKWGRGWQVWEYPVELEPAYEPFFHQLSIQTTTPVIDDGRRPTFFSSLIERFWKKPPETYEDTLSNSPEAYTDLKPRAFTDNSDIREIRIFLSPDQKVNFENVEQFLLNLSCCSLPISFEIIGSEDSTSVQISCRKPDFLQVRQQLQAYFPDVAVNEESGFLNSLWDVERETVIVDFGLSQEFMRPLRTFKNFETDILTGIIGSLENLDKDETGILQILFQAVYHPWSESIMRSVTDWEGHSFFIDSPEMVHLAKEKVRRPLFGVVIRVAGQSPSSDKAWEIAKALGSGLNQLTNPQSNKLIPLTNDGYDDLSHENDVVIRQTHRSGMLFNSEELVSIVHLPSVSVKARKLVRELKKTKLAPDIAVGHQLKLGENVHQGNKTVVSLSTEQRLRHMYIVGATGTGKSTLLLNMLIQDINSGLGVAVLDPHGDLIDNVLGYIPEERFDDVVLLDPSDADYAVGLNILSAYSELEKNVLSSDLVDVFRRLSTSWGDQMTSILGNAILAFLESEKDGTLIDMRRFLIEPEFRKSFLGTVKDQEVVYYWQKEFTLLSGKPLGPVLTRLNTFLRPKPIRYMVAQKEGLNFQDILDNRKIFLVKLSQGLIGEENAYLLGALLVSKLHQITMARQAKKQEERENFYLYLDEFQNFITPSMAAILSGARKYHLGLVLAHQELRQLWNQDTEVANSAISNPGTRICFRLGDFDARKLEDGFSFFDAQDLQNLGVGETICKVERTEYDFNLNTPPLPEIKPDLVRERQRKIIELSRKKYSLPREEVEAKLAKDKRWTFVPPKPSPEEVEVPVREEEKSAKVEAPVEKESYVRTKKEKPKVKVPALQGRGGAQHKYLQNLIKRMAEEKGYRAIIEQQTPDGKGMVDVGLESDGKKIACEISLTSTDEQELGNIEKCIKAGYDKVILCSPEKRTLEKVKTLALQRLKKPDQEKILFFQPEELFFYLEKEAAASAGKEERVKGYKVKVNYQPVSEVEKKLKREALAKVIIKGIRRQKDKT
ncbi:MAG: type IV secretory system conjugative DNA transfer family protein [Candidatus Scalinduaceae bacterium]